MFSCGGVAAIKDQGNRLAVFGELAIAADKGFGNASKHGGIVLVARVEMGKQGHMEVGADQKGQAEDAKIHALALGVAPLGQFGLGLGVDKGVEIGGIKQQGSQIDPEVLDQSLGKASSILAMVGASR